MTSILHRLLGTQQGVRPSEYLAREIAEASIEDVRKRLRAHASSMSSAELRGYVRARAMRSVRSRLRQHAAKHPQPILNIDELIQAALERVVHIVVRQSLLESTVAGSKSRSRAHHAA